MVSCWLWYFHTTLVVDLSVMSLWGCREVGGRGHERSVYLSWVQRIVIPFASLFFDRTLLLLSLNFLRTQKRSLPYPFTGNISNSNLVIKLKPTQAQVLKTFHQSFQKYSSTTIYGTGVLIRRHTHYVRALKMCIRDSI